jgi:RNA polymerase sigma-70 factor (ECF subfamily)
MMPSLDDHESWVSLRAGNPEAFERFYREYAARLLSFLRRCLGDSKAAEDVAQEAFLQLWQRPNGFNPTRGTLKAYLFGIGARRAADWWRHRPAQSSPSQPERPLRQGEPPVLMASALEKVGADARSLLWLREVEGYSYQELAEMLEIPLGTVKSRLFAAREQLRRIWKSEGSLEDI